MGGLRAVRPSVVAALSLAFAVAAMVVDHLLAGDWFAFAVSVGLCLGVAAVLFLRLIPRVERRPDAAERAATLGLVLAAVAIVPEIALLWLGIPIVVAGAGLALGLRGLAGTRRRLAVAAALLGAVGVLGGFALELGIELTDTETD